MTMPISGSATFRTTPTVPAVTIFADPKATLASRPPSALYSQGGTTRQDGKVASASGRSESMAQAFAGDRVPKGTAQATIDTLLRYSGFKQPPKDRSFIDKLVNSNDWNSVLAPLRVAASRVKQNNPGFHYDEKSGSLLFADSKQGAQAFRDFLTEFTDLTTDRYGKYTPAAKKFIDEGLPLLTAQFGDTMVTGLQDIEKKAKALENSGPVKFLNVLGVIGNVLQQVAAVRGGGRGNAPQVVRPAATQQSANPFPRTGASTPQIRTTAASQGTPSNPVTPSSGQTALVPVRKPVQIFESNAAILPRLTGNRPSTEAEKFNAVNRLINYEVRGPSMDRLVADFQGSINQSRPAKGENADTLRSWASLSRSEKAALQYYTDVGAYETNGSFYNPRTFAGNASKNGQSDGTFIRAALQYREVVRTALDKAPQVTGTFFRGADYAPDQVAKMQVGAVVELPGITSAAATQSKAFPRNSVLKMFGTAADLRRINSAEDEVIFNANSRFEVIGKYMGKNSSGQPATVIELRQVK
jgi:hypothetical protein